MKQGQAINRVVMLVLLAAILTYLGASAWRSLTVSLSTVFSYVYTLDDQAEATGFLVRGESVLPNLSTLADVLPVEGEKVAVNETVAYLYQDAAALERRQALRKVALELERLQKTAATAGDPGSGAKLTDEIMAGLTDLRAAVSRRDFSRLEEETAALRGLVYQRAYATGDAGGDAASLQAKIEELTAKRDSLTASSRQDTTVVKADRSGVFSGVVDGYEGLLTPANVRDLTPARLDELAAHPPAAPAASVGKLITDTRWYFVCAVSEDQAKRLTEGWQVKIRFSHDWAGEVSMRCERIGEIENGRVPVVFSSTRFLSNTTLLRRQTVDIVFSSVTGIRVPKNALVQDNAGQWGVYAVVGAQAEFKGVDIVGDDENYYLVQPRKPATDLDKDVAKRALRPGDEIILRADGLFDGKVVRAG